MSEIDQLRMAAMANADAAKMAEMELEHERRMNRLLQDRITELENQLSQSHADHALD